MDGNINVMLFEKIKINTTFINGAAAVRFWFVDYVELLADIIITAAVTSNHFRRAVYSFSEGTAMSPALSVLSCGRCQTSAVDTVRD